jgi:hypothetical protein
MMLKKIGLPDKQARTGKSNKWRENEIFRAVFKGRKEINRGGSQQPAFIFRWL